MTLDFDMYALSHRGRVRVRNEDSHWLDPEARFVVVADGMGGHPGGADASALAIQTFVDVFRRQVEISSRGPRGEAMAMSVAAAHAGIREAVRVDPALEGMGTTLTAAALEASGSLVLAHVGDSRAYRLRAGILTRLTRDHTWVAEAVERGILTVGAAANHPMSHVITQAVGIDMDPAPDVDTHELVAGDLLLLCSDGLTGPVDDDGIRAILVAAIASGDVADAPRRLVEAALDGGGPDNVTTIVVEVRSATPSD